jgi:prepilin-type N-terminal cleavage/methylation domain-containing protein
MRRGQSAGKSRAHAIRVPECRRRSLQRTRVKKNTTGFTLVEIAIVLVIMGLLLGGVVKGQELISSARVRSLISQQDGIKAAFFGFQDRYRALPGDYGAANTSINCGANPCLSGDANGLIEAPNASGLHEEILAWHHLSAAGFLSGTYAMPNSGTAVPDDTSTPKNAYLVYLQLARDGIYGNGTTVAPLPALRNNVKTGTLIPVELLAEVDRKIDDGQPYTGSFQFSVYAPGGFTPPDAAACTSSGAWYINGGSTNCGGVSLL